MLKFWKKKKDGQPFLYEEKPELENLELTTKNIRNQIGDSNDIIFRDLYINGHMDLPVTLVFVDGLINGKIVDDDILKPLLQETVLTRNKGKDIIKHIMHGGLYHNSAKVREKIDECIEDILTGDVALIFDKENKAITFDIKGFEKRSISEPSGENIIKGAKDSFVEVLRVNTALIRRKIKTQNLRIKQTKIGQQTLTDVAVVWIEGIANRHIVDELFRRLDSIKIDGAVSARFIEEFIIDNKWSMFPQVIYTERSDKLCQSLLDGRVGLVIDGLPTVYIVPAVYNMFFEAPEDFANNYVAASFITLLRYFSYFISLILPAFYIAITTFHQEMIPTDLTISIVTSKEGVPFPSFIEVTGMLIAFELLIEAGLRLPKAIGQAISIVGAVIVGQAAVSAKLESPTVVIIVALTGIAGFTMPNQDFSNTVRIWRLILAACSSIAGLFGIVIGMLVMGYRAASMESFGVPYLTPFAANEGKELAQDTIFRLPLFMMKKRPASLKAINKKRQT